MVSKCYILLFLVHVSSVLISNQVVISYYSHPKVTHKFQTNISFFSFNSFVVIPSLYFFAIYIILLEILWRFCIFTPWCTIYPKYLSNSIFSKTITMSTEKRTHTCANSKWRTCIWTRLLPFCSSLCMIRILTEL